MFTEYSKEEMELPGDNIQTTPEGSESEGKEAAENAATELKGSFADANNNESNFQLDEDSLW